MSKRSRLLDVFKSISPTFVQSLKVVAAIGLLLLLAYFIDVGEMLTQLKDTDWRWILLALSVVQMQLVLSAIRWKITAGRLGQFLGTRRAIAEYYLATLANLSLPGGVTGDAARVYRNRQTKTLSVAVHGVMLERLAGQIALLVVSITGWLLWPVLMQGSVPRFGVVLISISIAFIFFVVATIYTVVRFAPDWMTRKILELGPAVYSAWCADRQWIVQSVLSLAVVATYLLVFLLSSFAVGQPLPLSAVITIVPLVLLSMVVPISIGGWGVREAAAAILWPVVGLSSEAGIATSVVYALTSLIGCLPGLVFVFFKPRSG